MQAPRFSVGLARLVCFAVAPSLPQAPRKGAEVNYATKKSGGLPDCCHRRRRVLPADDVRRVESESCVYPRTSPSSSPPSQPWHQPLTRRNAFHLRAPSGLRIQDHTRRGGCACRVTRERSVGLPGVQQTSRRRACDRMQLCEGPSTERLTVESSGRRYLRAARRQRQRSMLAKGRPDQWLKTPSCQPSAGRYRFWYGPAGRCTSILRGTKYLRRASASRRRCQRNDGGDVIAPHG
jgi:hypothetical protein